MTPFFEINPNSEIGIKQLSDADLGRGKSNQTHIGLNKNSFAFLRNEEAQLSAKLVYNGVSEDLPCFVDYIKNPDGTLRSPKIRAGERKSRSILTEIRKKVKQHHEQGEWYLLWCILKNEEAIFFLFEKEDLLMKHLEALDLKSLQYLKARSQTLVEIDDEKYEHVLTYLEKATNDSNIELLQELEVIAQIGEPIVKKSRKKTYRKIDIEKAQQRFKEIGNKGEALVNQHLEKLKLAQQIINFEWVNQEKETGFPYDFKIQVDEISSWVYLDVKTTAYQFEQKMIFSHAELAFIEEVETYHIYRVYDLDKEPLLRICQNAKNLAIRIGEKIAAFQEQLQVENVSSHTLNIAIVPTHSSLSFESIITLK